jgi:ketopantoate reductase
MDTQAMVRQLVSEAVAMAESHGVKVDAEQREQLTGAARDGIADGASMAVMRRALDVAEEIACGG